MASKPRILAVDEVPMPEDPEQLRSLVSAFQSLARGNAEAHQQRIAVAFLLDQLCGLNARPSASLGDREAAFLAGKRWVAIVVAELAGASLLRFEHEDKA